jgi:phosphoglycerate dehydrogenase-like enzyme
MEKDLIEALETGVIFAAGLDVTDRNRRWTGRF